MATQTLNLGKVFNEKYSEKYGATIKYFHAYTSGDLNDLFTESHDVCYDLAGSRFTRDGIAPIIRAMQGENNITFIDTERPAMHDRLQQQQEREKASKIACDCLLPPADINSAEDVLRYIYSLDTTKKYEGRIEGERNSFFLTRLLALIMIFNPKVDLCVGLRDLDMFKAVHEALRMDTSFSYKTVKCDRWYVTVDGQIFTVAKDETGMYDLGPKGKANLDTIWRRYEAVPGFFGKEPMDELVPMATVSLLNALMRVKHTENNRTTLATIIEGGST